MEELRQLLFGREQRQLEHLQQRLENPALHAREVSRVLPQAVSLSQTEGPQLTRALTPAVEAALKDSVRRDPSVLVSAIFPIIGPAIRKAIAEAMSRLVQSLNRTLEHSLSLRGLRWRLEAFRTGKSFAEVVLAHTLVYRVEQVFLIHRRTSLLLQHVAAAPAASPGRDGDVISAMLSAIQDFVRDSFQASPGESLQTLQVGQWNVWLETGPHAMLAAVIRGPAPEDFHTTLQEALEKIHADHATALEAFDGDNAPFEPARETLETCLRVEFGEQTRPSAARLKLAVAVVLALALVWGFLTLRAHRRWRGYVNTLRAQEGIVVTDARKSGGAYTVAGLRDPLAADPAQLLVASKIDPRRVTFRWEPYQSLSADMILRRATLRLQPPPGVTLRLVNRVLVATGSAPHAWADTARRQAESLPGIAAFDTSQLQDDTLSALAAGVSAIEQTTLLFDEGTRLADGQDALLNALVAQIAELRRAAVIAGKRLRLTITGHTDTTGSEELNLRLSRQRAEQIVAQLGARGVPPGALTAVGAGSREAARDPAAGQNQPANRRATLRVTLDDAPTP